MPRLFGWVTRLLVALGIAFLVYSSRDRHAEIESPIYPGDGPLPCGGGRNVVGQPYEMDGRWYIEKNPTRGSSTLRSGRWTGS